MAAFFRTAFIFTLLLIGPWLPAPAHAAEPEPIIVRSAIDKLDAGIWVGQRTVMQLDVLALDGWAQIKTTPDFEVPGAYVVRLETQGTRLNETISGHTYGGQRYAFSLFPQQGGKLTVAPVSIDVEVRQYGSQPETVSRQMKTPAVAFDVKTPPGAENLKGIISTTELKAQQQWAPQSQEFKVGEAVKRTIVLSAPDISGMAFVPFEFATIGGLGIYPGETDVADSYSRGSLAGKRTETVTYVFEQEGSFELPQIVVPWWDIAQKKLKQVELSALDVRVSAGPGSGAQTPTGTVTEEGSQLRNNRPWLVIIVFALLAGIAWRFRQAIRFRWQAWRQARSQTEKAHLCRFRKACRKNEAMQAYNLLIAWLNRLKFHSSAATLDHFLGVVGSETLSKEVDQLSRWLFIKKNAESTVQAPWSGKALCREVLRARQLLLKRKASKENGALILTPLNPSA